MSVSGKWEGKLLDASGPSARVAAVFKQSRNRVSGEFSVYVESAREGCAGAGWKLAQTAPVSGTYSARGGRLSIKYELDIGKKPVGVIFDAKLAKADPHARRALIGSYRVADEEGRIGFEGGACILWRYRG